MVRDEFICPVCGETVPAKAAACPACGADDQTGWSDDTIYDGTGIEDPDEFDYDDWHAREVRGRTGRQRRWSWLWWLAALVTLLAVVRLLVG